MLLTNTPALPEAYRVKGEENYVPWHKKIINVAKSTSLIKYIYERRKPPEEVHELNKNVDEKKLEL